MGFNNVITSNETVLCHVLKSCSTLVQNVMMTKLAAVYKEIFVAALDEQTRYSQFGVMTSSEAALCHVLRSWFRPFQSMIDETVAKVAAVHQDKIFAVRLRGRLRSWHLGGSM